MDTEKYKELQHQIDQGLSPNDEGPYYHHSWWESYKGSVKGKFGGLAIGALVGGIMGSLIATIVTLTAGPAALGAAGMAGLIGAFAAGGAVFGVHEFSEIGKVTGAVAASQEEAEIRMKLYEEGKFSEIKQDIAELKAIVKGDAKAANIAAQKSEAWRNIKEEKYRTTHYAQLTPDEKNRFAFWKIAAIGLVVGLAAGALFAATGLATHLLGDMLAHGGLLEGVGAYAASMAAFGALGASFGLNRDLFRRIFDKTDLWFKGIGSHKAIKEQQIAEGEKIEKEHKNGVEEPQVATTVIPESQAGTIDYPKSNTYHRDKVLAAAEKALLSFDHTRATPQ